jgi:hypothetical protein
MRGVAVATYRRSAQGLGYKGIPALVFIALNNYGVGTQSHIEKLTVLDKCYAALRGYLPMAIEGAEYNKQFKDDMLKADAMLQDAYDSYDPEFEDLETCNPDEKEFLLDLRCVYIQLMDITARSKIIDDVKLEDNTIEAG